MSEPAEIIARLVYSPETGKVTRFHDGRELCNVAKNGYLRGRVLGELHYVHRLAVLCMTGSWPSADVDHIDGDRANNRWANLRSASRAENLQNRSLVTRAASGVRNVYPAPNGRWQVKVMVDGRSKSFGYFDLLTDAAEAAKGAKAQLHRFNPELRA